MLTMDFPGFTVTGTETTGKTTCVTIQAQADEGLCPACGHASKAVHST
jgi:hypothetical protein